MEVDRMVVHTDDRPTTEQQLEVMFTKARAAFVLGQQFTLDLGPRLSLTVTVDRAKLAEAHYAEQVRLATEPENRAGLERTRAALHAVGDPDPDTTIAFVGERTAFEDAQAEHVARFGIPVDNSMPSAYARAEQRMGVQS